MCGVMAEANAIRTRLVELQLERLEAESSGLVGNKRYMDDLRAEWADQHAALVHALLEEVLTLRCHVDNRRFG
jgi:hypothetical protein